MNVLILGAGLKDINDRFPDCNITTIDIRTNVGATVVHDLEVFPWPFADAIFDFVLGEHILEHLQDTTRTLEEICRICKQGATVELTVPYFRSKWQAFDPIHKNEFAAWSIYYYIPNVELGKRKIRLYETYTHSHSAKFKMKKFVWHKGIDQTWFQKLLISISYWDMEFYEDKLAPMFPLECMTWELEVLK